MIKALPLLAILLTVLTCGSASAQKTRDQLFPTFQKDLSTLQQKETAPDPRKTAASTRELIFTNYQRPAGSSVQRRAAITPAGANKPLPSDMPVTEAAQKLAPKPKSTKAPIQPQQ